MNTRVSSQHEAGFTLAEVLIALTLLAVAGIAVVGLMGSLTGSSVDARQQVGRHAVAVAVMESLLTRSYDELAPATVSGSAASGANWTLTIVDEDTDLRRLAVVVTHNGPPVTLETLVSDRN